MTQLRERLVPMTGTFNLRDVGGYAALRGTTRWRKLYRSDALHNLDRNDREELSRRGVEVVIDLRGDEERLLSPSRLDGLDVEVAVNPVSRTAMSAFLADDSTLEEMYDHFVDHDGDRLVSAVRLIARSGTRPVLVHCTAGKDRTGLVVALALTLAGVGREEVLRDYAATENHLPTGLLDEIVVRLRADQVPNAIHLDELVRLSPPSVLSRTLARIEKRHGSIEAYVAEHGLQSADIASLRTVLIDER